MRTPGIGRARCAGMARGALLSRPVSWPSARFARLPSAFGTTHGRTPSGDPSLAPAHPACETVAPRAPRSLERRSVNDHVGRGARHLCRRTDTCVGTIACRVARTDLCARDPRATSPHMSFARSWVHASEAGTRPRDASRQQRTARSSSCGGGFRLRPCRRCLRRCWWRGRRCVPGAVSPRSCSPRAR
jgi:hypothetical protein